MSSLSAQFEEVRRRAESHLSVTGSAQEVKADVMTMAETALPLSDRYHVIAAEEMVMENVGGQSRPESVECLARLLKALSILEKYGCNLTSPARPKYWRSVKHNNPVFRATVDAVTGGRAVLKSYGYTNQMPDGLSFPDSVTEPDVRTVAAATIEVMTLRVELDALIKGTHPHPQFFEKIIPSLRQQEYSEQEADITSDSLIIQPIDEPPPLLPKSPTPSPRFTPDPALGSPPPAPSTPPTPAGCDLCGGAPSLLCPACGSVTFCDTCDVIFHRHPDRAGHRREPVAPARQESCTICGNAPVSAHCLTCSQWLCTECDRLYHNHPNRGGHTRQPVRLAAPGNALRHSLSSWECVQCTTVNELQAVLCVSCERPRLASASLAGQEDSLQPSTLTEWECKSCTVLNSGSSVLCAVCERPRLAMRPTVTPVRPTPPTPHPPTPRPTTAGPPRCTETQWMCEHCTFSNPRPASVCAMCNLPQESVVRAPKPLPALPINYVTTPQIKPQLSPGNMDTRRQNTMKEEGLMLVRHIRDGEKGGLSPEEVYAALQVAGGSNVNPCDWLKSELPHLLDEICAMAASVQQDYKAGNSGTREDRIVRDGGSLELQSGGEMLSRAEAKMAWLVAGGDAEKAVQQLLKNRQVKVRELRSLGFQDCAQCEEALRLSGGDLRGALSHLQRPLMEPFHQRIWSNQPEPPIEPNNPDKQRMCRRLLALYDLPSWGRCELALSLLQDPKAEYALEDVIQAVQETHDRDVIHRMLNNECPMCLENYPLNKMRSLTSCQCSICLECFKQHFTIAVRDKHIRDMVCPACEEPDINNPEDLDNYFSTLDIQLRDCLDDEVLDLFHTKLTEHALMKDPKFLWCSHCTQGFIYEANQPKVTCPDCRGSFCVQCRKPWEDQHEGLSCEQFQGWKRENDPEFQRQGLAGYLRDNGITCPNCRYQYALTKGGCMHFTCGQCRYQFCSGCNNPFHKSQTGCAVPHCIVTGLHAHHPRDCLFYLRDWVPPRLQALLQKSAVDFNTDPPNGTQTDRCGVMEQKDEGGHNTQCGIQTQPGYAGLCDKHYREFLVSLINGHSLDPAPLFDETELAAACRRCQVDLVRGEAEDDGAYHARQVQKVMEIPLGENVPRKK